MGIANDGTICSTTFVVPTDIPTGSYALSVVANAIASPPVNVTVG
jgi:hypothetical protein